SRVTITPRDIDSVFGLCTILSKKREGSTFVVHVECKGTGGSQMLGDVTFTPREGKTIDFTDQVHTYKAVLHRCPDLAAGASCSFRNSLDPDSPPTILASLAPVAFAPLGRAKVMCNRGNGHQAGEEWHDLRKYARGDGRLSRPQGGCERSLLRASARRQTDAWRGPDPSHAPLGRMDQRA